MQIEEIVDQIGFVLGIPANDNVEGVDISKAVGIALREAQAYMSVPVYKTLPFSTRIDLGKHDIRTTRVKDVSPAYPKVGINMSNMDSSNVFQLAASQKYSSAISSSRNMDPIINQLAMAQLSNQLSTDFQWKHDLENDCLYITCKQPRPSQITISYIPEYKDVSEVKSKAWINLIIRLAEAYTKKALGRSRSKYTVEGSNVSLDGQILLDEANAEIEAIHEEMENKTNRLVIVN